MKKRKGRALGRRYGRASASSGARYEIYGLVPKRGGGHLKKRHLVGRARDAHEALVELYRVTRGQGPNWTYIIIDQSAKQGRLAPIVTEDELRHRQAAGE
jgi:hypothetical protein